MATSDAPGEARAKKVGRPTTDPASHRVHSSYTLSPAVLDLLGLLVQRTGQTKSALVEAAIRRMERATREEQGG